LKRKMTRPVCTAQEEQDNHTRGQLLVASQTYDNLISLVFAQ
jgi:hypothetical protein